MSDVDKISIWLRRGTAAEWEAANPVLLEKEMGFELDTNLYKVGDGMSHWNELSYNPSFGPEIVLRQTPPPREKGPVERFMEWMDGKKEEETT